MTRVHYVTDNNLHALGKSVERFADENKDMVIIGTTFSTTEKIFGTSYHQAFISRDHLVLARSIGGWISSAIAIGFICCVIGSSAGFIWWLFHR